LWRINPQLKPAASSSEGACKASASAGSSSAKLISSVLPDRSATGPTEPWKCSLWVREINCLDYALAFAKDRERRVSMMSKNLKPNRSKD
jgi:hypothetical protein